MTAPFIIDSGPSARGWSYYAAFLRCPMLFFWKYVYARRQGLGWNDTTPPLARGTLVHVGLAHHYARKWAVANGRDPERIPEPLTAMRIKSEQIGDVGIEMLPVAVAMVGSYWKAWPVDSFDVVSVEQPVEIKFGSATLTARVDRTVQDRSTRKILFHDIKTSARLEGKTVYKYTNHGQFFGHTFIGRAMYGDRFGGVMIDIIDERGEVKRIPPEPAPFALRTFPSRIERANERIEECKRRHGDSQEAWMSEAVTDEQTCVGPYGKCPAFDLCRWGKES